jgi:hypothetical protein
MSSVSHMPKHALEDQLAALTREFVGKLVEAIRNASFAEVAALSGRGPVQAAPRAPRAPRQASPAATSSSGRNGGAGRQTAERRAELGQRVVRALEGAKHPLGVRAIAAELGVPADLLATPLRELRQAGTIRKHGEKRATTYSLA